ncbi:MAG: hypothetical protein AVDCRST_MAG28-18 [uncultured Rubrobacteraceae bacterium]|uniref:Uncharacterized protein n=1 Tax=uncultured Rubrobacteraceae bacterium TaxID=349277 RepID=A0A6J4QAY8_9ACTN|nr:MAG: hypothetical protein AVDCRST_MAG28-18 [uncultured Rubrobacteraceae bacterium]
MLDELRDNKRDQAFDVGGSGVSGLYEVATWFVYALAAIMLLAASVAAVLAGLGLKFVATFLRELGEGREEGDTQHAEDDPRTPTRAKGSR